MGGSWFMWTGASQSNEPLLQSLDNVNLSPMTPVPLVRIPGFRIRPLTGSTKGSDAFPGSLLGMTHGFTQRGTTGITSPPGLMPAELEALKASAMAVALTVFEALCQMRENK